MKIDVISNGWQWIEERDYELAYLMFLSNALAIHCSVSNLVQAA